MLKPITNCRICNSKNLTEVIDLGEQMLATVTVTKDNRDSYPKHKFPLVVVRCDTQKNPEGCGLVQLLHTYPSSEIYREYWYRSSINQTMRDALLDVVMSAREMVELRAGDVVLDIGCNDGELLSNYLNTDVVCYGIDPVENIKGDNEDSFTRIVSLFNADNFLNASGGKRARIITSIAMFYDLDDPNQFVSDIANSLSDNGVWVVQMADLPEMIQNNMFDQIIHEHLEYYHIAPFQFLLEMHGLKIVDIEKNSVNGSSYRFYVRKNTGIGPTESALKRINVYVTEEDAMGLNSDTIYAQFREGSEKIRNDLKAFVAKANSEGQKVVVYGASTKGNIILQYCGFTSSDICCAAERNPRKWGGYTVGSDIPIVSENEVRNSKPEYLLILPYYFLKEIYDREKALLKSGTKFLVPVPQVHVIDIASKISDQI